MHRIKYVESATVTKKEMDLITHQIDSVKSRMDFLRKEYKILNYDWQSKELTEGMVDMLVKQKMNTAEGKKMEQWLNNISEHGGEFDILDRQKLMMITQLEALKKIYDEAISGSSKKIIYGQRIQNPIPADKKSYPVRSLIVFFSTFAALFTAILVILFLENKKNV